MAHVSPADAARLRTLALCLARQPHCLLGTHLPVVVPQQVLSLCLLDS